MGANQSAVVDTLLKPDESNVASLKKIFTQVDRNKDGSFDTKEWVKYLSDPLWAAFVESPAKELASKEKDAVKDDLAGGGMIGKMAASLQSMAVRKSLELSKPKDKKLWVLDQYRAADSDHSGSISFDEFVTYLRTEAKEEYKRQRQALITAFYVAGGDLHSIKAEVNPTEEEIKAAQAVSKQPPPALEENHFPDPQAPGTSHITVKALLGNYEQHEKSWKLYYIVAKEEWTVTQLKEAFQEQQGTPVAQQRMILAGKILEDEKKLNQCGLEYKATVHLSLRAPRQ